MMAALSLTDRPQLRRGVRAGTDPLSGETVLLFPEGVLMMNETAAAVVGSATATTAWPTCCSRSARRTTTSRSTTSCRCYMI
jgi:hypothetical protein